LIGGDNHTGGRGLVVHEPESGVGTLVGEEASPPVQHQRVDQKFVGVD
jgi:hypothetical protein